MNQRLIGLRTFHRNVFKSAPRIEHRVVMALLIQCPLHGWSSRLKSQVTITEQRQRIQFSNRSLRQHHRRTDNIGTMHEMFGQCSLWVLWKGMTCLVLVSDYVESQGHENTVTPLYCHEAQRNVNSDDGSISNITTYSRMLSIIIHHIKNVEWCSCIFSPKYQVSILFLIAQWITQRRRIRYNLHS